MEKTDKSMVELEIDYNQRIGEWSLLTESEHVLKPLYGPGFTGLKNVGNSCYLNSVVQVLFSIPDFQKRFYDGSLRGFLIAPQDAVNDFNTQMSKLAYGLLSGKYSKQPEAMIIKGPDDAEVTTYPEQEGIKPQMFKNLIGKGHHEFSTKRQQDAQEFYLHLINIVDRNHQLVQGPTSAENPTRGLSFQIEERIQCLASNKVTYTTRNEYLLSLPIPLDAAVNLKEFQDFQRMKQVAEAKNETIDAKDVIRPKIPLKACFNAFTSTEHIEDFYSTAIESKTMASKTAKLKTFPDFLMIQVKKFTLGEDWSPQKLDVAIDAPDELDLCEYRAFGLQPGEEALPEKMTPDAGAATGGVKKNLRFEADVATINQLKEMGFTENACNRAVQITGNVGVEVALNWLFEHQSDANFNDPFDPKEIYGDVPTSDKFVPNPEAMEMLKSMGIPSFQAKRGLKETVSLVDF